MKRMILSGASEDIHSFRVAYKHHCAIFRVANLQQQNNNKIPERITKIYRLVGKIRDLQIQKKTLNKYLHYNFKDGNDCLMLIQSKIEIYKIKLARFQKKHLPNQSDFREIDHVEQGINISGIEIFILNMTSKLKQIQLVPNKTNKQLHTARKLLKDIWYALAYLDFMTSILDDSFEKRYHEASIVRIMNELGNFHDTCTSINLFKELLHEKGISKSSQTFINRVLAKLKINKQSMKANCLSILTSFSLSEISDITIATLDEY